MTTFDRADFLTLIQSISGLEPTSVFWSKDPNYYTSPTDEATLKLTVRAVNPFMQDETRYSFDPSDEAYTELIYGVRDIIISMRVEQFNYQSEAIEVLELVKTSMQLQSVQNGLIDIGLALKKTEADIAVVYEVDNREVNVAQCDFTFNVVSSVSFTQFQQGWIDAVDTPTDNIPGLYPAAGDVPAVAWIFSVFTMSCLPVVT